ncbi:uracil phosphoribosyltransferase [Mycoplasma nasistruthionis]|uniref:Uracil phosphoribosyltransferase n=1 Tax=Mycoplasma nasistruthionis TaxID=353852 RepID=A0A4Y6I5C7_9MOLU|nr:uracil phosphoribosyltransferase [Mycoplasma nasistruthionis]QCZ36520.1 uracil phosphoribosyltransferase [Mycoplasma nasistruthionis]QDF64814.1 uracil phosphoribosyltransferase [Mycoplasma nasistruthionis]
MKVTVLNHPLIQSKITTLRNIKTDKKLFKTTLNEIAQLLVYETTSNLQTITEQINTPITSTLGYKLKSEIVLVVLLRAGMGLLNGFSSIIPDAEIGFIGLKRNEQTLQAEIYLNQLPSDLSNKTVIILDPILATGNSTNKAIELIKKHSDTGLKVKFVGVVGCQVGVDNLLKENPDIEIYLGALDEKLNEHGYLVPGLGDAGDRLFGKN